MNESTRKEILIALDLMWRRYPDWRFGQMVANISGWAAGPTASAVWDVEDEAFWLTSKALRTRAL